MDILYSLKTSAPLDLTIDSIKAGHHANLKKRMDVQEGDDVFWFYGLACLGAASIESVQLRERGTLQFWTGPLRMLTPAERRAVRLSRAGTARGGAYARNGSGAK
jgi:hypothetical protein